MRLKQQLTNKNDLIKLKAIHAHAKFVDFVVSEINKRGLETVLPTKDNEKLGWLREAYKRVLDFAEQYQLKQVPNKVEGPGENGEFKLIIEISDENKTSQSAGGRISQYVEI